MYLVLLLNLAQIIFEPFSKYNECRMLFAVFYQQIICNGTVAVNPSKLNQTE